MYYELERLLKNGERCVITGIKGSGKSTLISKFSSTYNSFRSMWYCSEEANKKLLDKYQLFDRCNYIDRYAYHYKTEDAKQACIEGFREMFSGTVLILLLNDKWSEQRKADREIDNDEVVRRMLDISFSLFEQKIIKTLVVSTKFGWWSTEFSKFEEMKELIERGLNRND